MTKEFKCDIDYYRLPTSKNEFKRDTGKVWHSSPYSWRLTRDEDSICKFIETKKNLYKDKKVLHVGTGCSEIAKQHSGLFKKIDGITVGDDELKVAEDLEISNYKCYKINKYNTNQLNVLDNNYDIIIDCAIKTYMCCKSHYLEYWNWLLNSVKPVNGEIITFRAGFHVTKLYSSDGQKVGIRFPELSDGEIYDIVNKSGYTIFYRDNNNSFIEIPKEVYNNDKIHLGINPNVSLSGVDMDILWIKPKNSKEL